LMEIANATNNNANNADIPIININLMRIGAFRKRTFIFSAC
jgi:hypothetical protein